MPQYALSLKQPWATLLVHGLKTVEVRKWPARRRGTILIHAARIPDPRAEAWAHVPKHLVEHAQVVGGLIGSGELVECITYRDLEHFQRDQPLHLNEPRWFNAPIMYGFRFTQLAVAPYRHYAGWMRFFPVEDLG